MSRTRISHLPGDAGWHIDGPAHASVTNRTFAGVPADNVGSMRPILTSGVVFEANRMHRPKAFSITGKPKP